MCKENSIQTVVHFRKSHKFCFKHTADVMVIKIPSSRKHERKICIISIFSAIIGPSESL